MLSITMLSRILKILSFTLSEDFSTFSIFQLIQSQTVVYDRRMNHDLRFVLY